MQSKQGRTLPFMGLSKGHINVTTGKFVGATTFKCVVGGNLKFKYNNASNSSIDTQPFLAGDEFGIDNVEYIEVSSGTFHIGFD